MSARDQVLLVGQHLMHNIAPKGNAVKHFCSRIRENSGVVGIAQKSHDFSYH